MEYECNGCRGRYHDPQQDGTRYFHVCSPLDLFTVKRGGDELEVTREKLEPSDDTLAHRTIERPDHRDERIATTGDRAGRITAEGAGATEVGPSPWEPGAAAGPAYDDGQATL